MCFSLRESNHVYNRPLLSTTGALENIQDYTPQHRQIGYFYTEWCNREGMDLCESNNDKKAPSSSEQLDMVDIS